MQDAAAMAAIGQARPAAPIRTLLDFLAWAIAVEGAVNKPPVFLLDELPSLGEAARCMQVPYLASDAWRTVSCWNGE